MSEPFAEERIETRLKAKVMHLWDEICREQGLHPSQSSFVVFDETKPNVKRYNNARRDLQSWRAERATR